MIVVRMKKRRGWLWLIGLLIVPLVLIGAASIYVASQLPSAPSAEAKKLFESDGVYVGEQVSFGGLHGQFTYWRMPARCRGSLAKLRVGMRRKELETLASLSSGGTLKGWYIEFCTVGPRFNIGPPPEDGSCRNSLEISVLWRPETMDRSIFYNADLRDAWFKREVRKRPWGDIVNKSVAEAFSTPCVCEIGVINASALSVPGNLF